MKGPHLYRTSNREGAVCGGKLGQRQRLTGEEGAGREGGFSGLLILQSRKTGSISGVLGFQPLGRLEK